MCLMDNNNMTDNLALAAMADFGWVMDGQKLAVFKGEGFTEWLRVYENFCKKYKMDSNRRLADVGFYLGGMAGKWDNSQSFSSWEEWKLAAKEQFNNSEGDYLDQLAAICMTDFESICEFLPKFCMVA
ncbi:hypothetical protein DSO57_1028314 [Entomophthora muscae]|uniref:Uncharacterized protein n=1 Tax=Entomophthora muscae TaxID=34485 RepID=A0ACC2TZD2_9FUNG|nr:hypothetical protein DSO57_1028314 [Entomophthora muscae]